MKRISIVFALGLLLATFTANAQIQVGLGANYSTSVEKGSQLSDGIWGGSATVRYFLSPKVAVGLNARYFTKSESEAGIGKISASSLIATPQIEYFFSEGSLRPYVGLEAGIYHDTFKYDISGYGSDSQSQTNFGGAPKLGLQYMFTPAIGIDVNAGYHYIFYKGGGDGGLLLGAGVVFNLGQ